MLNTTINIRTDLLDRIEHAEIEYAVKRNFLIMKSVNALYPKLKRDYFINSLTRYQPKNRSYSIKHIRWSKIENEGLRNLKDTYKLSVSFIIGIALELFLDQVIRELCNETDDSYPLKEFTFLRSKQDGIDIFIFCWGKPEKEIKIPPSSA